MKDRFILPSHLHSVAPISYGYQECDPGHSFGPAVRNHYLLHYVFSGCGSLEQGGEIHTVNAGDLFVICPGEITTYSASESDPWNYCWLGFTSPVLFDFLSTPVLRQPPVRELFRQLADYCDHPCPDSGVFAVCFGLLQALAYTRQQSNQTSSDYALYTKIHLDNSYMKKVSIANLAEELHIDRRYLTTIFKKTYGVPPQEYLTNLRLERALEFLQAGYSVTNASAMSGFSDLCNFSRRFKDHYGYTPASVTKNRLMQPLYRTEKL